jgi:hypothetical protein
VDFFCITNGWWGALVAGCGMPVNVFLLTTNETAAFVPQSRDYGRQPNGHDGWIRCEEPRQSSRMLAPPRLTL